MFKESIFKMTYVRKISSQILVLPYVGKELNMIILLPNENTDLKMVMSVQSMHFTIVKALTSLLGKKL